MTDKPSSQADKPVGYGSPPVEGQFQKGQSGNPKGRPRKPGFDAAQLLNQPVAVREQGRRRQAHAKEVILQRQLKKALDGDVSAMAYLFAEFEKHDAFGLPQAPVRGGVIELPPSMPVGMGARLVERYGPPPWSAAQIAKVSALYLRSLSEEERAREQRAGYTCK